MIEHREEIQKKNVCNSTNFFRQSSPDSALHIPCDVEAVRIREEMMKDGDFINTG